MAENLPYVTSVGTLRNMLEKIKTAAVPGSFSQEFVADTLSMKGGTAKATMPFLKKMGFVGPDQTPTERYKAFRNEARSGEAVAEAMRELYSPLFAKNESAQDLERSELVGLIVETTGGEKNSQVTKLMVATFEALKAMAVFRAGVRKRAKGKASEEPAKPKPSPGREDSGRNISPMHLSYTINLNLPATADIDVFNAIFKSLRNHLLDR